MVKHSAYKTNPLFKNNTTQGGSHGLIFGLFAYYLMSLAFDGIFRHVLTLIHMQTLIYARDLIAILTILYFIQEKTNGKVDLLKPVTVGLYILIVHAVLSLWLSVPLISVFFSFKIFIGVLYGTALSKTLAENEAKLAYLFKFIFTISVAGVFLNYFIGILPWEGDSFDSAFGSASTTKIWWADGERRIPGFSRSSYSAAGAIGITGIYWMASTKSKLSKSIIYIAGCASINITTSKGMVAAFAAYGLWLLFTKNTKKNQGIELKFILTLALLCVIIPVISALYDGNPSDIRTVPSFLSSFWDRISSSWPDTFKQLDKNYGYLLGKGLGGVGIAINISSANTNKFVPVDNIFWHAYSVFGLASLIYFSYAAKTVVGLPKEAPETARQIMAVLAIILAYGITSVIFEEAFFSIVFGAILNWPKESQKQLRL